MASRAASDGPWVGAWRPHRPKGPISAQLGNPGPKYALPGLIGAAKHDLTKYKAPMYSFGSRHKRGQEDPGPGPAMYSLPPVLGPKSAPAYTMYGRLKKGGLCEEGETTPGPAAYKVVDPSLFQSKAPQYSMTGRNYVPGEFTVTPGPGAYEPELPNTTRNKAPSYTFGSRHKVFTTDQTPGPGAYTLPPQLGAKTAPAYSIYGRIEKGGFYEDNAKTPGPAAYKVVDPSIFKEKAPRFSMTGRNYAPDPTTQTPGPAAYNPEIPDTTKSKAPSYTFGSHHIRFSLDQTPGPGAYSLPPVLGAKTAPAYSMYGRLRKGGLMDEIQNTPGPAAYQVVDPSIFQSKAPQYTMTGRNYAPGEYTETPGPGAYDPELPNITRNKAPSYTFGSRHKMFVAEVTPGPGAYTLPPQLGPKTAPAYSIYGRIEKGGFYEDKQKTPGPAAYRVVDPSIFKEKAPRFSMTGRNYAPDPTTQTPGPAAYNPEMPDTTKSKAPSYTFGSHHIRFALDQTPGPAAYSLPPVLGAKSAPAYTMYGHLKKGGLMDGMQMTPGPAAYKVVDPSIFQSKAPQFSMTGRNFAPAECAQTPGPGAYEPELPDTTRNKAPSYTFGTRHKVFVADQTPGPGAYTLPPQLGTKVAPAYSIYGRLEKGGLLDGMEKTPGPATYRVVDPSIFKEKAPRFSMTGRNYAPDPTTQTPGPAAYNPEIPDTTKSKAPSYTFGSRHKKFVGDQTPGPGAYSLPPVLGPKTAPAYSMYGHLKTGGLLDGMAKTPGPATYQVVDPSIFKSRAPQYSMTGRNYAPAEYTVTPGPGAYEPELPNTTRNKAPSYTFGSRHKVFTNDETPGPGAYTLPPQLGPKTAPAYSIYGRIKKDFFEDYGKTPGPAAYHVVDPSIFKEKAPRFSMTGRNYAPDPMTQTPGPAAYNPEMPNTTKTKAPSYTFGSHHIRFALDQTPGPAAYTLPPVLGSKTAPAYTMYGRLKKGGICEEGEVTPGPAAYKVVDPSLFKEKAPQFSMTGRHVARGFNGQAPGPGSYDPETPDTTKSKAPSFTFGVRHSPYLMPF